MPTAFMQVKNRAVSTAAGAIDNSTDPVTFSVAAGEGAKFPATASGHFNITIDSEILHCTSRSTDALTCARAQEGTSIAAHSAGAPVMLNVTALALTDIHTAINAIEAAYLPKQMEENDPLLLDAALGADGKYSGIVEAGTAGAALAFGNLVYLAVADSKWELTDANAAATAFGKLGICVLAAAEDAATTILLWGKVNAATAFPDLTIGAPVFVGTTAGDVQVAAPTGTLDIVRIVGYGNTADELFFAPDNTYLELV